MAIKPAFPGTARLSRHPLDPLGARRPRLKRIAEVLGLAGHLPIFELHDAHRARRLPVVSKDEFGDPEVGSAEDAPHGEALHARLCEARRLAGMEQTGVDANPARSRNAMPA